MATEKKTTQDPDKARREKILKNVKLGGSLLMYIGSAGLMNPLIKEARQNQSGPMKACSFGAGTILSLGLGSVASKVFNKLVDKTVDFYDDVKPKHKFDLINDEEDEKNA